MSFFIAKLTSWDQSTGTVRGGHEIAAWSNLTGVAVRVPKLPLK